MHDRQPAADGTSWCKFWPQIADYERQAANVGSAPEGAQIVQFGRLDGVT
jgi:hypothetical protein